MAREIFLDQHANAHEAVQAAVAELEAGGLVCLPDECGWNLAGLSTNSATLTKLKSDRGESPVQEVLSIAHPSIVSDFVTNGSRLLQKLTARCWPGPVVLRATAATENGLISQWPEAARSWGVTDRGRAFYCPAESFTQEVLRSVTAPLVSLLGGASCTPQMLGLPEASLTVYAGTPRFSTPPTVVAVRQNSFQIECPGVVSERMLTRLAGEVYLFVCTGNTCRSPMAEGIFRKMLADHLHCREDELIDHGYVVISAGLAAYHGAPASPESLALLRESGIDLSSHESQPVTEELLQHCDQILTMTRNHRDAVLSNYPELASQVRLLSPRADDVPDPFGASLEEYIRCQKVITECLEHLLAEIDAKGREGNGA